MFLKKNKTLLPIESPLATVFLEPILTQTLNAISQIVPNVVNLIETVCNVFAPFLIFMSNVFLSSNGILRNSLLKSKKTQSLHFCF